MIDTAFVKIWGQQVGAIAWDNSTGVGSFEYLPEWIDQNIELSPIHLPIANSKGRIFDFPELSRLTTFKGLPGLVADILPDKYGKAIIDSWLARQGRPPGSLNPVEVLCFIGQRGMGAIEIEPSVLKSRSRTTKIELESLINIVSDILAGRKAFSTKIADDEEKALLDVLRVGTSAGGARAKAVIAYNPKTNEIRSGQTKAPRIWSY